MNNLKDLIRLIDSTTLKIKEIASSLKCSPTTVYRYREILTKKELTWSQLEAMSDDEIDKLFNKTPGCIGKKRHPDWSWVHDEVKRRGVIIMVIWDEYRLPSPDDALSYSQFCDLYTQYKKKLNPSMRQIHLPGQRTFVDFSGERPHYLDQTTGKKIYAELFIGVLGFSNYIYAEAIPSQQTLDWLDVHVHMFEAFGGSTEATVPDNLRSAVTKAGHNGEINRAYKELAAHYNTAIIPTRVRKPKDKAKVEGTVLLVKRWVLKKLRNQTFYSLASLNKEIFSLVDVLNRRPFAKMTGSRFKRFNDIEKASLRPLPAIRFEPGQWTAVQKVPLDYHVHIAKHWYSVPYIYIGKHVDGRIAAKQVEIYCSGVRIASHLRGIEGGTTTDPSHLPPEHRAYANRTSDSFIKWATGIGPATTQIVEFQFDRRNPMLGLKVCDAIKALDRKYGSKDLELAARRAVEIHSLTQTTLASLLRSRLFLRERESDEEMQGSLPLHYNIRGGEYFSKSEEQ